jgi:hypothetical protein
VDPWTRVEVILVAGCGLVGLIAFVRAQLAELARMQERSDQNAAFMRWVEEEYLPEYCRQHNIDPEDLRRQGDKLTTTIWR